MDNNRLPHETELAFFGTITASVSHELNNVLSIINEYSGLLDDLVLADNKDKPIEKERIQKIALNIAKQIKREQVVIKLLSRFAHRVDNSHVKFNLNELVTDITRLSQRFASLKRIELGITIPKEQITLTNNPFAVQHAIFSCLKLALEYSNMAECVNIKLETKESKAIIKIESPALVNNEETERMINFISVLSKNLGGDIENIIVGNNRQLQQISIPFSIADGLKDHQEDSLNEH
jgi:signal transduction histidine kinase